MNRNRVHIDIEISFASDPPSLTVSVKDGELNASYCLMFFPAIFCCVLLMFFTFVAFLVYPTYDGVDFFI